ncbi:Aminomethyltransferase, mitochondrial [Pyricularia oryzae]
MRGLTPLRTLARPARLCLRQPQRNLSRVSVTAKSQGRYSEVVKRPVLAATTNELRAIQTEAQRRHASGSSGEVLHKTALYDLHVAHGGKMVPFAGYHMPVQYSSLSVSASHVFTREKASLFDVGHMVQRRFSGPGAAAFLERVTPSGVAALKPHHGSLTTLLHRGTGGIVDDTIVTRLDDELFYVVTNAGCRDKDNKYFADELAAWDGATVKHEVMDGWGLVALQGPLAKDILADALAEPAEVDLPNLHFGMSRYGRIKLLGMEVSAPLLISRGGYTGEDGFEISIPEDETVAVTQALLTTGRPERLQLAGLGARDSLRLEAGMCLYGHDLDDTTTPVEAGLSWVIPKARRETAGFHGAEVILPQLVAKSKGGKGVERRRVGLVVEGAPAREGADIVSSDGATKLGKITSGCPSPTLGKNIAMGYIQDGQHKAGTEVAVLVRGKPRKAVVTKMPFIQTKYWKGA